MARVDDRRAASQFFEGGEPAGPVRPLTPIELLARLAGRSRERSHRHNRIRSEFVKTAQEEFERRKPTDQGRSAIKEKEKQKGKSRSGDFPPKTKSRSRPYRRLMEEPRPRTSQKNAAPDDGSSRAQRQRDPAVRTSWLYGAGQRRGSRSSGGHRLLGLVTGGAAFALCGDPRHAAELLVQPCVRNWRSGNWRR